ncbi:MAG: UbiA family prenyltransferase [archaeon]
MEEFFSKLSRNNFIFNLLILGRPWNAFLIGLFSLIGFLQIGSLENLFLLFLLFFSFFLQYTGGTILNDVYDISADRINMPYRPLESGVIKLEQAKLYMIASYFISFVLGFFVSYYLFIGLLVFFVVTILYSVPPFRFVARGFIGNFSLATVSIFIPSVTGLAVASKSLFFNDIMLYLPFIFLTIFFSFFSIIKDFKDVVGDSKTNKKTFVVQCGETNASKIMIFGSVLFFLLSCFYFSKLIYYINFYYFFSAVILISLIYIEFNTLNKHNSQKDFENMFSNSRLLLFLYSIVLLFLFLY